MRQNKKIKSSEYYKLDKSDGKAVLEIYKPLTLDNAGEYDELTLKYQYLKDTKDLKLNLSQVSSYDSYLIIFVNAIKKHCRRNSIEFEVIGASEHIEKFLAVLSPKEDIEKASSKSSFFIYYFTGVGDTTKIILGDMRLYIEFFGELIQKTLNLFIRPKQMRWKDFPYNFTRAGVSAVPITFLIVFLIGIITGYQGALQLQQFGADIYIADLIGISITRELAPLMTAILVAGRSGSAFAAELGTMKVSDEIDAMYSMGFDPIKFLVLPRVLAVTFAMPLLVILNDVAGIAGGLIAAIGTLDITVAGYLNELQRALSYGDLFTGLGKSMIFGFLVATVGCFRGLQVKGGAESVGKYTTIAVVNGVLLIIIADAVFTFIFQSLGI